MKLFILGCCVAASILENDIGTSGMRLKEIRHLRSEVSAGETMQVVCETHVVNTVCNDDPATVTAVVFRNCEDMTLAPNQDGEPSCTRTFVAVQHVQILTERQ
jgi:ACT domain-containing protein